ncbi:hypothetical protein SASPL_150241 [Salvia splendens]|uniref:Uncharacterized protein n=1 Tax=Salvia splendens TaxID=180675 RepID=A0A8X8W680_SALSN|nr:hypothetical protein SASPL_150241 [Salvia splendens]
MPKLMDLKIETWMVSILLRLSVFHHGHETRYTRLANWDGIVKSHTVRDFDTHATCLVGKYETVDTFYRRCSSSAFIGQVSVPLLCISALDDPVCTREAIPWDECRANKNVVIATSLHGGHLAFFEGITGSRLWWVRAINEFLGVLLSSPYMHKKNKAETVGPHSPRMQTSIDQGPYLNLTDGMVAAMGNEHTDGEETREDRDQTDQTVPVTDNHVSSGRKSQFTTNDAKTSEDNGGSKGSGIVRRCLHQVSRQSNQSIWLLAYIATMSSWPLAVAALRYLHRRKLMKSLPGRGPK